MNWSLVKSGSLGAASLVAATLLTAPAFADGISGRGRIAGEPARPCTFTANVGATTDYVFRGISQTNNDPAVQGGVDATCGRFYFGFWGSNVDIVPYGPYEVANVEMDVYAGFKTTTGPISWDLGAIYYTYPGQDDFHYAPTANYVELKVGASGDIWKGGTLGATVFYSPEGSFEAGPVWTVEGTFSQALPKFSIFTPTLSAALGRVDFSDKYNYFGYNFDYTYWNVGVTLGFHEKWSLDIRYWDTDLHSYECESYTGRTTCDGRVVGTLKYTF